MDIFLSVLKVAGIVLLCIVLFMIAILLLILLVPYRYKIHGEKSGGISAYVKVTWLLHFVVVLLTYDDGINLRIKILGIPFYDRKRKAQKARLKAEKERLKAKRASLAADKRKKKDDKEAEHTAAEADPEVEVIKDQAADETAEDTKENIETGAEKSSGGKEKKNLFSRFFRKDKNSPKGKKESFDEFIDRILDAIWDICFDLPDIIEEGGEALLDKIEKIREKIEELFGTIEYYHRLLGSEGAEWVYEYVKKHVLKILKAVKPTRFDALVNIADDDPANVAKVYEYEVYALPFIELIRGRRGRVIVNAYQDEKYFDMNATLKGHVFLLAVAWHGMMLLFNKKVKAFIKRLKREEEAEEKKKNG